MANKHLSRDPQTVNDDCWYYEEDKHIIVVMGEPGVAHKMHVKIPWAKLRRSLKRKDKI